MTVADHPTASRVLTHLRIADPEWVPRGEIGAGMGTAYRAHLSEALVWLTEDLGYVEHRKGPKAGNGRRPDEYRLTHLGRRTKWTTTRWKP